MSETPAASIGSLREGPQRRAIRQWSAFSGETEIVVHLTHEGLSRVRLHPEFLRIMNRHAENEGHVYAPEQIERAEQKAQWAQRESDAGFPLVHAHALLGLWGGLECLVEDLFLGGVEQEPSVLQAEAFKRIKLPISVAAAPHGETFRRAVLLEAQRAVAGNPDNGVGHFEALLETIGLKGDVPRPIRDAVFQANQIRNVWAHRGGIADERFTGTCGSLGFAIGDRVDMTPALFHRLEHGLHMYGVVLTKRLLAQQVPSPELDSEVWPECPGYEGVINGGHSAESAGPSTA